MKKCEQEYHKSFNNEGKYRNHGPSSFDKLDFKLAFEKIEVQKGTTFVDLGCGAGDYSFYASNIVGPQGTIYAVDIWNEILVAVEERAKMFNISNLLTVENDICKAISLKDNCADNCLLSTVMHGHKTKPQGMTLFSEINRILKPGGKLAIIECKKADMPFGPPMSLRISPEELVNTVTEYGFIEQSYTDLSNFYLMIFTI